MENLQFDRPLVFFDLETTGISAPHDRIVELTAIKLHPNGKRDVWTRRMNPGMPIPKSATEVHGIRDEDVAGEPGFPFYAEELRRFIADADLGGFGISRLDIPLLEAEFRRAGVEFSRRGRRIVDAQILFHMLEPRDLAAAYRKYHGADLTNAHTSEGDVDASMAVVEGILRMHPELNLRLVGADVTTRTEAGGLAITVNPGTLERVDPAAAAATGDVNAVAMQRGTGTVQLVQYGNGDWRMLVEGKPYFVQGLCYSPTRIGVVPWEWNWLWSDENTNGVLDSFEVWVDANQNNRRDPDEPITSDYQLMKDIGCNTIKFYLTDAELPSVNVLALRKMYRDSGIRAIVGNFLGAYCNGSGADWDAGTDYKDPAQRANMRASVSNMVMKLRGEPWVLAWVLGNENNMEMSGDVNATRTNGSREPEAFAGFLNEVAAMIHEMDPNHPVGVGNLLTGLVEYYGKFAPELDFIGINSYLGEDGFGATWQKVKQAVNRPVCIMEWGCDSYYTGRGPDEEMQARYIRRNLADIEWNSAGHPGAGNAIGGFVFEWLDEWWKDTLNYFEDKTDHQTTRAVFPMPFPDGQAQEEWFGIMGQGAGNASPFQRVPKKAYYAIKDVWVGVPEGGKEELEAR